VIEEEQNLWIEEVESLIEEGVIDFKRKRKVFLKFSSIQVGL